MNKLFLTLIIKQPILFHLVVLLIFGISVYVFFDCPAFSSFSWVWAGTALVCALLAQIYSKVQDLKISSNVTSSELNRLAKSTDNLSATILKILFFHIAIGIGLNIVLSTSKTPPIAIIVAIALIPVWLISLYFGYLLYKEILNFNAIVLKRKLEGEQRQASLKKLNETS